jgi:hypothetical protein
MPSSADILRATFPGRVALSPKEIAKALHGSDSKKRVERVREALDDGILIPGLRKRGSRWSVPIAALAEALDAQAAPLIDARAPGALAGSRRKSPIGPRLLFQQARARKVWGEIFIELQAEVNAAQFTALTDGLAQGAPSLPRRMREVNT